jgi:hypothetical protein
MKLAADRAGPWLHPVWCHMTASHDWMGFDSGLRSLFATVGH